MQTYSFLRSTLIAAVPVMTALLFVPARAAQFGQGAEGPVATVTTAVMKPAALTPGSKGSLVLTVTIKPGFHINANKPDNDTQIPTEIELTAPKKTAGVTLGAPVFPAPKTVKVSYSDKPLKVYEGTMTVTIPVTVSKTAPVGKAALGGSVRFQGCNDTSCFPPASADFTAAVTIGKK